MLVFLRELFLGSWDNEMNHSGKTTRLCVYISVCMYLCMSMFNIPPWFQIFLIIHFPRLAKCRDDQKIVHIGQVSHFIKNAVVLVDLESWQNLSWKHLSLCLRNTISSYQWDTFNTLLRIWTHPRVFTMSQVEWVKSAAELHAHFLARVDNIHESRQRRDTDSGDAMRIRRKSWGVHHLTLKYLNLGDIIATR